MRYNAVRPVMYNVRPSSPQPTFVNASGGRIVPEMRAVRRDDPDAAGPRRIDVAGEIDLHAVGSALALNTRDVEKHALVRQAARAQIVGHPPRDRAARVRDVEDRFVGRQHEAVRPFLLARQQLELAVRPRR